MICKLVFPYQYFLDKSAPSHFQRQNAKMERLFKFLFTFPGSHVERLDNSTHNHFVNYFKFTVYNEIDFAKFIQCRTLEFK